MLHVAPAAAPPASLVARVERETAGGPPSRDLVLAVLRSADLLSRQQLDRVLIAFGSAARKQRAARGEGQCAW